MRAVFDWLENTLLPLASGLAGWMFIACLIQIPFLMIRRARHWIGGNLYGSSFVFGVVYWLACLIISYRTIGIWWTLIGVVAGGFGVVPLAFIGAAIYEPWSLLLRMVVTAIPFFMCRTLGLWIWRTSLQRRYNVTR
jgi:hypothetical protein